MRPCFRMAASASLLGIRSRIRSSGMLTESLITASVASLRCGIVLLEAGRMLDQGEHLREGGSDPEEHRIGRWAGKWDVAGARLHDGSLWGGTCRCARFQGLATKSLLRTKSCVTQVGCTSPNNFCDTFCSVGILQQCVSSALRYRASTLTDDDRSIVVVCFAPWNVASEPTVLRLSVLRWHARDA